MLRYNLDQASQQPRTRPVSFTSVKETQVLELSSAAFQGTHVQEAGLVLNVGILM